MTGPHEAVQCPKCNKMFKGLSIHQKKLPNCDEPKKKRVVDKEKYPTAYWTAAMRRYNEKKRAKTAVEKIKQLVEKYNVTAD